MAVVDPSRRDALRAIAEQAGFSKAAIRVWEELYLAPYDPSVAGDMDRATEEAKARIAERMRIQEVVPELIYSLPNAVREFGVRLQALLDSFGLSFQGGTLDAQAIEALYRASQA